MFEKREVSKLVKEYDRLCEQFSDVYNEFVEASKAGKLDVAKDIKVELVAINSQIEQLQSRLDEYENLPNYDRKEGLSIKYDIMSQIDELMYKFMEHEQGKKDENGNNAYENDGFVDERRVPKEDARKAAEAWGEGYQPLIDFLETCISNGIQTFACCAGHSEEDLSYVLLDGEDERVVDLVKAAIANKVCESVNVIKNEDVEKCLISMEVAMQRRGEFYEFAQKHVKGEVYREPKEGQEDSIIEQLIDIMKKDKSDKLKGALYFIWQDCYKLEVDGGFTILDAKEMRATMPKLKKMFGEKERRPLIERIKERCSNARFGLSQVMETGVNLKGERMETVNRTNESQK